MNDSEDVDSLGLGDQVEDGEWESTQECPPDGFVSGYNSRAAREDLEASEQPVQVSSQLVGGRDTQALMGMAEVTRQPAWPASTLTLIVRPES